MAQSFLQLEEAWKYLVLLPAVGAGIVVGAEWIKYFCYGDKGKSRISTTSPYGMLCILAVGPVVLPVMVVGGIFFTFAPYKAISLGPTEARVDERAPDGE